jgi:hypothetical protein
MTWYLARRLTAIVVGGRALDYEQGFFVVHASSLAQAKKEATRLSRLYETTYQNKYGQDVTWEFQGLTSIADLGVRRLRDGMWLFRRDYPGVSRIAENSDDRLRISARPFPAARPREWFGAMLLFRARDRPLREEERLLLFRATWGYAYEKALRLGKQLADKSKLDLLGTFQVHDLDATIRSGTEVYWRFFKPSELKHPASPPRPRLITVPVFAKQQRRQQTRA